jgi:predicted DNA binding protein
VRNATDLERVSQFVEDVSLALGNHALGEQNLTPKQARELRDKLADIQVYVLREAAVAGYFSLNKHA